MAHGGCHDGGNLIRLGGVGDGALGVQAAPGGETDPDRTQPQNEPIEVPDEGVIGTNPPSEPPAENKPKGWQGGSGS